LVVVVDLHRRVRRELQLALGPLDADLAVVQLHLDVGRVDDGLFADAGHRFRLHYQTVHSSSPPRCWARAWRSLITPLLVLRMAMPRPSSTGLSWFARRYRRRPGLLARSIRRKTRSPSGPYFKKTRRTTCGSPILRPGFCSKALWPASS